MQPFSLWSKLPDGFPIEGATPSFRNRIHRTEGVPPLRLPAVEIGSGTEAQPFGHSKND